jgi:hypothetical protein
MTCSCHPSGYETRYFLDAFKSSRAGCSSDDAPNNLSRPGWNTQSRTPILRHFRSLLGLVRPGNCVASVLTISATIHG